MKTNSLEGFISLVIKNGGASYSLQTGIADDGVFASYKQEEKIIPLSVSKERLKKELASFVKKNAVKLTENENYIGGWLHEKNIYLDISRRFDNIENAVFFGMQNEQLAVFSFKHGVIELPTNQSGTGRQKETYARMTAQKIAKKYE
jgi:hypothetical protein